MSSSTLLHRKHHDGRPQCSSHRTQAAAYAHITPLIAGKQQHRCGILPNSDCESLAPLAHVEMALRRRLGTQHARLEAVELRLRPYEESAEPN